jgi:hypothetical protein
MALEDTLEFRNEKEDVVENSDTEDIFAPFVEEEDEAEEEDETSRQNQPDSDEESEANTNQGF